MNCKITVTSHLAPRFAAYSLVLFGVALLLPIWPGRLCLAAGPSVKSDAKVAGKQTATPITTRPFRPQVPNLRAPYATQAPWHPGGQSAGQGVEHADKRDVDTGEQRDAIASPPVKRRSVPRSTVQPASYSTEPDAIADNPFHGNQVDTPPVFDQQFEGEMDSVHFGESCEACGGAGCDCGQYSDGCSDGVCGCGDACGSCGEPCCGCGGGGSSCPSSGDGLLCYGWIAQGVTLNTHSPNDRFNGPLTFNDRSNEYQMNQLYLVLEDCVDRCGSAWDIGGRVDLLYGTDYFFTTAAGLETNGDGSPRWNDSDGPRAGGASLYGLALPQLYAEVFAPLGNGLSVKMGHFYSPVAYESVMYTNNFFYSHSYIRQYGEPFTHLGLLADYKLSPCWTIYSGFTRGWNNWEDVNGQLAYLGGLSWCRPDDSESIRFFVHTGNEDDAGENNRTVYSLMYSTRLRPTFAYALEYNFGYEDNAAAVDDDSIPAHWYGIAQYFICQVNCRTQVGVRAEWFRDEENARVLSIPVEDSVGGNYIGLTLGANYRPRFSDAVEIRPELRWDWSDVQNRALNVRGMYGDFDEHYQLTLALSAAVKF